MATKIQRHNKHYSGDGFPRPEDFASFKLLNNDTYFNKTETDKTKTLYKYNKTLNVFELTEPIYDGYGQGERGDDGWSAYEVALDNGFVGTEEEWLASLKGEKGDKGDPGSGGGTVVSDGYLVVRGNGTDDTADFQQAVNANKDSNRPIMLVGNIKTNQNITVPVDSWHLTIDGYGAVWNLGSGVTTGLKRVTPSDMTQATAMTTARHALSGVEIVGNTSQTGIDLGPSYGAVYRDMKIKGLSKALWNQFALNTTVENIEVNQCVDGIIVDILHITGANASNSQSNQTTLRHCRAYGRVDGSSNVAFGIYGSSGCSVENCIGEGGKHTNIVKLDYLGSPNVKDFRIKDIHLEAETKEAFLNLRLTGRTKIDGVYSQLKGILIKGSTVAGTHYINVEGVVWQVPDANGKAIQNDGGCRFIFENNTDQSGFTNPATISKYFTGTALTECNSSTCGPNTYQVK